MASEAAKSVEKKPAESSSFRLNGSKLFGRPQRGKLWRQRLRNLSKRDLLILKLPVEMRQAFTFATEVGALASEAAKSVESRPAESSLFRSNVWKPFC